MLKEGEVITKLNEAEICRSCSVLCTAEYCVETIQQVKRNESLIDEIELFFFQLEDKMKEKITKSLVEKISFEAEKNVFKS